MAHPDTAGCTGRMGLGLLIGLYAALGVAQPLDLVGDGTGRRGVDDAGHVGDVSSGLGGEKLGNPVLRGSDRRNREL